MRLTSKARKSSVLVPVQPAPWGVRSVVGSCSEGKVPGGGNAEEIIGEESGGSGERSEAGLSKTVKLVREGLVLDNYLTEPDVIGAVEAGGDVIEENLAGSGSRVLLTTRRRGSRSRIRESEVYSSQGADP
jgi:hypothetical protein